jgi:hypothetical protein
VEEAAVEALSLDAALARTTVAAAATTLLAGPWQHPPQQQQQQERPSFAQLHRVLAAMRDVELVR